MLERWMNARVFSPDGEGGGAGGTGAAGDGKPAEPVAKPAAAAAKEEPASPAAPYVPDGLPEHLRGKDERETLDKVWAAQKGARDEIAKRGTVPKEPGEYKIEWTGDLAPLAAGLAQDPVVKDALVFAHKHGLTDKQANGFLNDLLAHELSQGRMGKTVNPDDEARALLGDKANGLPIEKIREQAAARHRGVTDWVEGLLRTKAIDQDMALAAAGIADVPSGLKFLEAVKALQARPHGIQAGGEPVSGGVTRADLEARIADPRYQPGSDKYDPAFRQETMRLFREHYPTKAA